jgi:hypothetical protein
LAFDYEDGGRGRGGWIVAHDQEVREILKCHRPRGAAPPVSLSRRH